MVPKYRCWFKNSGIQAAHMVEWDKLKEFVGLGRLFDDSKKSTLFTLMQSTGLKDKNGVEIFEGDIVFDRWANMYTPVFQNGIYMAYNPKNLMQNDPSTQFNIIWKDGCEVIGNIYENPELLEQANES